MLVKAIEMNLNDEMVIKKQPYNAEAVKEAAKILGSMYKFAKVLEVSYNTVFRWCNNKQIPTPPNCIRIEKATEGKIKREDILPEYPWEDLK